jgi:hypothetical protein
LQIFEAGRASIISSEKPNPEDQARSAVQRSEPHSRVIYSDSIQADPQTSSAVVDDESSTGRNLLVILILLLGFAVFAAGGIYWYQTQRFPVVVAITPPDRPAHPDPLGKQTALIPLSPDLIHVTSIALGTPRLTIVNGKRLAEEDWLVVKTPVGEASARVISIQDGFVRFKHGGETIDARLQLVQATPSPH